MSGTAAIEELLGFAIEREYDGLKVLAANASLDERQDGELVTRVVLLVSNPGEDEATWQFQAVRDLKKDLAVKAVELDLPPPSVSLVPEDEADEVGTFSSGSAKTG